MEKMGMGQECTDKGGPKEAVVAAWQCVKQFVGIENVGFFTLELENPEQQTTQEVIVGLVSEEFEREGLGLFEVSNGCGAVEELH